MSKPRSKSKLVWFYLTIGVLARLIPHPANFTPITNLCMFSGSKLPKYIALPAMLLLLAISDALLAHIYGYPIFSSWSIFTYSGFAAMVLISTKLKANPSIKRLLTYLLSFSLGFWLWTNFGVWLTGYYPHTFAGLISCYTLALPFLRNALLGNLVWMAVIWGSFVTVKKFAHEG